MKKIAVMIYVLLLIAVLFTACTKVEKVQTVSNPQKIPIDMNSDKHTNFVKYIEQYDAETFGITSVVFDSESSIHISMDLELSEDDETKLRMRLADYLMMFQLYEDNPVYDVTVYSKDGKHEIPVEYFGEVED